MKTSPQTILVLNRQWWTLRSTATRMKKKKGRIGFVTLCVSRPSINSQTKLTELSEDRPKVVKHSATKPLGPSFFFVQFRLCKLKQLFLESHAFQRKQLGAQIDTGYIARNSNTLAQMLAGRFWIKFPLSRRPMARLQCMGTLFQPSCFSV